MIVFFRRIPAETKLEDLVEFIEPALKGGWFRRSGQISKVEIIIFKDVVINKLEYHALATIEPDKIAERMIKKLNRKPILGKHIAVREYVYRLWHNDRRINYPSRHTEPDERRKNDRRRGKNLELIDKVILELDDFGGVK